MRIGSATLYSSQGEAMFQEDALTFDEDGGVLVVADGFGGPAGTRAAQATCNSIRDFLMKQSEDLESTLPFEIRKSFSLMENVMANAFSYANANLCKLNDGQHVFKRGGASAIGGFFYQDRLTLGGVGNVSAWLARDTSSEQWVRLLVPRSVAFRKDPFEVVGFESTLSGTPTSALGLEEDFHLDLIELEPKPGDWLVVHTAGFRADVFDQLAELRRRGFDEKGTLEWTQQICKSVQFKSNASLYLGIFK